MHWFDICVIVLLIASTVYSLVRGLIKELFSLSAIIIAFILAHRYFSFISANISDFVSNKIVCDLLSFGFIFIFSALIVSQIGKLVRKLLYKTKTLTTTDRVAGGLLGLVKGILIVAVIMIPIGLIPSTKKEILAKAKSAPYILNISRELSKISFSDKNILENMQDKIMKNKFMENIKEKLKLPDMPDLSNMKDKVKTGLDAITGTLKSTEKDSTTEKDKKNPTVKDDKSAADNITKEDKEKLKQIIDELIDKS